MVLGSPKRYHSNLRDVVMLNGIDLLCHNYSAVFVGYFFLDFGLMRQGCLMERTKH